MKTLFVALLLSAATLAMAAVPPTDAQIDAAMKKADPDGDGTVSRAEATRFGLTKKAFRHADANRDGTLDKQEFVAAITYQFEHLNPDKDGTLDRKEAAKGGVKGKKHFDSANPDNDGTLDLGEYLEALTAKAR